MEKNLDFLDLSCRRWVFLWNNDQEKIISTGQEALDAWQLYKNEVEAKHWRLEFPFRAGVLQSSWALRQVLQDYFQKKQSEVKNVKRFQLLVASVNTEAEKQAIAQLVSQTSLRPAKIIDRASFFNRYLQKEKNFSKLKLIMDVNQDFIELSLFLENEQLKVRHLALGDFLTEKELMQKLNLALDGFLLNLSRDLFSQKWQYFYLFIRPGLKQSLAIDELNQHLKMEGILNQEPLANYV